MATGSPSPRRFEPTWKRLVGATLGLFVAVAAFLAGRVATGGDHAANASATRATTRQQATTQQAAPQTLTPPAGAAAQPAPLPQDTNPPRTHSS